MSCQSLPPHNPRCCELLLLHPHRPSANHSPLAFRLSVCLPFQLFACMLLGALHCPSGFLHRTEITSHSAVFPRLYAIILAHSAHTPQLGRAVQIPRHRRRQQLLHFSRRAATERVSSLPLRRTSNQLSNSRCASPQSCPVLPRAPSLLAQPNSNTLHHILYITNRKIADQKSALLFPTGPAFPERRPAPASLTLNLSSNNPFRNRNLTPSPRSADPRMSKFPMNHNNPFLDASETAAAPTAPAPTTQAPGGSIGVARSANVAVPDDIFVRIARLLFGFPCTFDMLPARESCDGWRDRVEGDESSRLNGGGALGTGIYLWPSYLFTCARGPYRCHGGGGAPLGMTCI